jgi:hypothetical protein
MLIFIEFSIFKPIPEMHAGFHLVILKYEVDELAASELKVNTALIFIQIVVVLLDPLFQRVKFIGKNILANNKSPL